MEQKNMTALVSAFARWYHSKQNKIKIFDDYFAENILTAEEKQLIANSMIGGINFFNPTFDGTEEEALRWIVDNQLSPSPLGRSAWSETALENAVKLGVSQYIIIASGYDTFACRNYDWTSKLNIFELDQEFMIHDKKERLARTCNANLKNVKNVSYVDIDLRIDNISNELTSCSKFSKKKLSFCSLLGISYYLSKEDFKKMVGNISSVLCDGSTIVFDYPDEYTYTEQAGKRTKKQLMMASGANEAMLASYSYQEIEGLLSDGGFLIYEHLQPDEITKQYFSEYNLENPNNIITAFDNVNYCLAVKK